MRIKHLVLFVGPSAVGKGSLYQTLLHNPQMRLKLSCSVTTREPRVGEIDGIHYHFVDRDHFLQMIANGELVEYNEHFNNYYGTPILELERITEAGYVPFLEIETEGAKQILEYFRLRGEEHVITSFFIAPPSITDLEDRLRRRNTEDEHGIALRLQKAEEELREAHMFQYYIINDNVLRASREIQSILMREIFSEEQ